MTSDGRSALAVGTLDGVVVFYEFTVIDTQTGAVYQSCRGVNSGCSTDRLEWYGPLIPDETARVIGQFDDAQLNGFDGLGYEIRAGFRAAD